MELIVVERIYEEPLSDETAAELRRKAGPCFQLRNIQHRRMYLSKDRRRAICLYDAPDAATVRDAHEQEGFAYAKIWAAIDDPEKD